MRKSTKKSIFYMAVIWGAIISLILAVVYNEPFRLWVFDMLTFFETFDTNLALLWIFLFMLIGNSTNIPVGIPAVYFFAKSIPIDQFFWGNMILFSLIAGIGAGTGQLGVYALGRGASAALKENQGVKNLQYIAHVITERKKLAPLLVFIFAFTPIPDQILMLPLGAAKFPLKKLYIPSVLGKASWSAILIIAALVFNSGVGGTPTVESIIQEAILMAIIFSILVLFVMINWESIFSKPVTKQSEKENKKQEVHE